MIAAQTQEKETNKHTIDGHSRREAVALLIAEERHLYDIKLQWLESRISIASETFDAAELYDDQFGWGGAAGIMAWQEGAQARLAQLGTIS